MGILELVLVAIRGLSVITNNPALGGGSSLKMKEASDFLALLGELVERGDEAHDELVEFTGIIEKMVEENRGPNREELQTLRDRSDAAHDVIQDAAAEIEAEEKAKEEEEQRLKDEAEAEEQRLKEEALKEDLARLSDEDLQFSVDALGIVLTEGMERAEIEALVLKAKLEE